MLALPKRVSVLLFPVCGLLFLVGSLTRPRTASHPTFALLTTSEDMMPQTAPASLNASRRIVLRKQLHFYYLCQQRLSEKGTWQQRVDRIEMVHRAVASYNQAVADTDPSAFDYTDLPRHL